jgi:hypothetical protein
MANISKFRQTLNDIRVEAVNELIGIMKKHDCEEVETYEFDDTPIVINSKEVDSTSALDTIRVVDGTEPYLIFGCSSSYDCEDVTSNDVAVYNLVEILEWVLSNEKWLFESEGE